MEKLAFIFTGNDLRTLQPRDDFAHLQLIAVTPEADFAAEKEKVSYKAIEDYYDELALNKQGIAAHTHVKELCLQLDREFFSKNLYFSAHDIFMFIKLLYDQLLFSSTVMQAILKAEKPTHIILPKLLPLQKDFWQSNDGLLLHVMTHYCKMKNLTVEEYESSVAIEKPKLKFSCFFRLKQTISKVKWLSLNCMYNLIKSPKSPVVFIAQHWDFETCLQLKRHFKIFWLKDCSATKQIRLSSASNAPHINLQGIESFFQFEGVSLLEVIRPKLEYLIHHTSLKYDEMCKILNKIYQDKKINIVVAASGQSLETLAAIRVAKRLKLPVIWGQHGGLYGYAEFPIHEYLTTNYTHYFLYTSHMHGPYPQLPTYVTSDSKLLNLYKIKRHAI